MPTLKHDKMFQIDLNSDLIEEHYLQSKCWFILFGWVTQEF